MAWDKTRCEEGILAPDLNDAIRANYEAIESDINREHKFSTGGTPADQIIHRQGSARCFWQATAPAKRLDGVTAFTSDDLGSVWIKSTDKKIYILTATTPTWTLISTELFATFLAAARVFGSTLGVTGNFAVNTDKFTVVAASGNTAIAGSLDPTSFVTTKGGFKDEDDMASDSAIAVASQQSIKAYIDALIAAEVAARSFGVYTNQDDENNVMLKSHAYLANQDGFVVAIVLTNAHNQYVKGYIGTTTDPAGAGDLIAAENSESNSAYHTIYLHVSSGKYFEITSTAGVSVTIRWFPIGTLVKPTDKD